MMSVKKLDGFTPEALFGLLHRKHLLSLPVRSNPALLASVALNADFYAIHDGDQNLAYLIETRSFEPEVLELAFVPEDKNLSLHKEELARISRGLRERWFTQEKWGKVEVRVPKSRQNACRSLRALGFECETRSCGIRKGITLGKEGEAEALHVFGMLVDSPYPDPVEATEEAHA